MNDCKLDESECSFCGKEKEGVTCTIDGAEVFFCKADFWKMLRLRSAMNPKEEKTTPLFEPANSH